MIVTATCKRCGEQFHYEKRRWMRDICDRCNSSGMTCARCGVTGESASFVKPRPNRRPRCRRCDAETQREWRYLRLGERRQIGEPTSAGCLQCGQQFPWVITAGQRPKRCPECRIARAVAVRRRHYRAQDLKKKYGMTLGDFDQLLAEQGGRCAICGADEEEARRLARNGKGGGFRVDHCHESGEVRGLLCDVCNRGLGFFRDDPRRLLSAATYLEASGP